MHPTRSPNWTLHRKRKIAAWPFIRLWKVCDPTLFQMILVTALLATVLGDCNPPPRLDFASPINVVNETSFKTGTILKYACRPGYSRASSSMNVICKQGGVWDYIEFCTKKRCRNPGDLPNGNVVVKTDFYFGAEIEFSCLEGYLLTGPTTSHCDVHDKSVDWSNPLPVCSIIHCKSPPAINNGRHNGREDSYIYGSSVTYSCDPNFSLVGKASISCMVENKTVGVWSPNPPTCKKIICAQPEVPNGIVNTGSRSIYNYKDTVMLSCNYGYILRGSRLVHCEEDNNWHPSLPTCELNSCTNVPEIPHANWEVYYSYKPRKDSVYNIGTVLRYSCNSGYRPVEDEPTTITCQEDLTWTPYRGCERVCCPKPELKNGKIVNQRKTELSPSCHYFFGDQFSYTCHKKSKIFKATCQGDGTWNPKTPTCDDDCDFPPDIAHGHHKKVVSYFSNDIMYECDDGYTLVGQAIISCRYSTWSPPAPVCKAVCLKPKIENGNLSVDKSEYDEDETPTVQCNRGYRVVGSQSISCSENRTWYPEVSKCEWEVPEGCEKILAGRNFMQCLPNPQDVKLAMELYKLSLEIEQLERERDKAMKCTLESPP
ncbi:PREDICTED: C4b-binding protein alpha chain-like [Chrysochloris asiatica]|uniref:C4b-binding protein alpha chain-like n=1 Tax=Chrysochloris asiatica TaxID=185453 RepID=A0A9B0T8R4_CHRAS|nr:PREDICTED: C4b-binding protein alpha chain-like [Chrysochloris asiatica]